MIPKHRRLNTCSRMKLPVPRSLLAGRGILVNARDDAARQSPCPKGAGWMNGHTTSLSFFASKRNITCDRFPPLLISLGLAACSFSRRLSLPFFLQVASSLFFGPYFFCKEALGLINFFLFCVQRLIAAGKFAIT